MSKTKHITIKDKVATYNEADGRIVCKNGGYEAEFIFDEEWDSYQVKRARFTVIINKKRKSVDIEFRGNKCPIPPLANTQFVEIGVYVPDEICTTTPATIGCDRSTLCGDTESVLSVDEVAEINGTIIAWMEEHIPEDGADGKSAYELAKDAGFEGTEEEWLASLKGEEGKQGPPGQVGPQGEPGQAGQAGPEGPRGPMGYGAMLYRHDIMLIDNYNVGATIYLTIYNNDETNYTAPSTESVEKSHPLPFIPTSITLAAGWYDPTGFGEPNSTIHWVRRVSENQVRFGYTQDATQSHENTLGFDEIRDTVAAIPLTSLPNLDEEVY